MSHYNAESSSHIPINAGDRSVGYVEDGIFKKRIRFSKHALERPPALAFSIDSLNHAIRVGANICEVTNLESSRVFWASIDTILLHGFEIKRGEFERQIALPLSRWRTEMQSEQLPLF